MRTKHVLMAMMLPAVFAACTSDDFMEQPVSNPLANRALLSTDFSVNVPGQANTRFAWENLEWKFEEGDGFGAGVVDPVTIDDISSSTMLGNYVFAKNADGKFVTNSQMVEGTYMFYSYDGFQNKSTRDLISFDLGTQTADLSDPEAVINDKAKQLFFSPLYKLEAETSKEPLNLGFYPYWSAAAFRIQNNTEQDLKISQIILKDEDEAFVVKGEINPTKLNAKALKFAYDEESGEYAVDAAAFKKANGVELTDEAYGKVIRTADIAEADAENGTSSTIALNCGNYELADGAEVIAYMNVPVHVSEKLTVTIIVVDEEGQSKQINVTEAGGSGAIASTGISTLTFSRDRTNPVFGFNTDGKTMKALNVKKDNLQDAKGFYVDNKEDLLRVINSNRGAIDIHNFGDLAIDDDIATAIAEYTGAGVTFNNPIALKCTDTALDKITFNANVTVESGEIEFNDVELASTATMTVKAGKVTLTDGTYNASSIVVEGGELILNKENLVVKDITNKGGIVTIAKANSASNFNLKFEDTDDEAGDPIATTLNINAKLAVNAALTTGAYTTVNNASEITVSATLKNKGVFNNGTESSDAAKVLGEGTFENAKTVNNYGTIVTTTLTNNAKATVANYKWFGLDASDKSTASTNNGKIEMKKSTSRVVVTAGNGEIDNTAQGYVTAGGNTVSVTISEDMKDDEVIKELGTFTKLYLNSGTWTIADATNLADAASSDMTETTLVLNGGTINIAANTTLTVTSLHVEKTSTVMGDNDTNSQLVSTTAITAAANATLNVEFAKVTGAAAGDLTSKNGVYYITQATTISNAGAGDNTVTYKAYKAQTASMTNIVFNALAAKVVIGTNVTLNLTGYADTSNYTSLVVPTMETIGSETYAALRTALVNALPDLADEDSKVSIVGGKATAEYTVTFTGTAAKKITLTWNGETWEITAIEA